MYFGPITGARAYKWVGSLYVGVGRGLYVGWSLYVRGRLIRVCVCVCVCGGGGVGAIIPWFKNHE